ncbi:hypothetical protein niasHS_016282 [Heterodera schachtii]|uniref:B30.2/SPRY domain-containing protein n=1 Tax=Heterodera schachtii TaxID=97005 RepID=A0ABD2I2Q1_HETSC
MNINTKKIFLILCFIICTTVLLHIIFFKLAEKKNSHFRQLPINKTFNRWALPAQYNNNTQQLDCYRIVTDDTVYIAKMAKNRIRKTHPIDPILDMSCDAIRSRNYFLLEQTEEDSEDDFPFAQAKTIYKDYFLLEMELAATYSPKNWYCYVLDTKSDRLFKRQIRALAKCFPNILIGTERKLNNDGEGMAEAYLDCLTMLAKPHRQWKYVSLLQNHDTAIKTRFQIMQILKWLDGANDAEITNPGRRINRKLDWTVSALSLFHNKTKMAAFGSKKIVMTKGNVAATLSRQMVEYVLNELDLTEMLRRLNQVEFGRDEYLFPTLNSVDFIGAPGGASQICIEKRQQVEQFTRAVVWVNYSQDECASRFMRHGICVFGMEDLGINFIRWPHMYANKFLPEFDLGASVCWYEALYNRTQFNSREEQLAMLDKQFYLQLPNVRFQKFKNQLLLSKNQSNGLTNLPSNKELMHTSSSAADSIDNNIKRNTPNKIDTQTNDHHSSISDKFVPYPKFWPKNNWNYSDCHPKLHLIKPNCLKVLCLAKNQNDFGGFSVRAKSMVSNYSGFLYFEVKIQQGRNLCVGLATKLMPLDECIGRCVGTYAYDSAGIFRTVGAANTKAVKQPKFGAGDIIGCGVQLATRQLIYTKNGERLNTANVFARQNDLCPCVTLKDNGDMIEANFGPNFKYNLQLLDLQDTNKENYKN